MLTEAIDALLRHIRKIRRRSATCLGIHMGDSLLQPRSPQRLSSDSLESILSSASDECCATVMSMAVTSGEECSCNAKGRVCPTAAAGRVYRTASMLRILHTPHRPGTLLFLFFEYVGNLTNADEGH